MGQSGMTELKPDKLCLGGEPVARSFASHRESADDYHSVIIRSDKYRVIICKGNLQWIHQHRVGKRPAGVRWDSFKYFRAEMLSSEPGRTFTQVKVGLGRNWTACLPPSEADDGEPEKRQTV